MMMSLRIMSYPLPSLSLSFLAACTNSSSSSSLFKSHFLQPSFLLHCNSTSSSSSTPPVDHLHLQVSDTRPVCPPPKNSVDEVFPSAGGEDALAQFISGHIRLTDLAHALWRKFVRNGDVVVDATCGNGHDTLALLKMVADESTRGCVYGFDIQDSALQTTSRLLDTSANPIVRKLVKLFTCCHSKMEDVVRKDSSVRLVAFNLGYLPGGDKSIITSPETTLPALQAAGRILGSGGVISVMVYVGHPGGMDELEVVKAFASSLSPDSWACYRFEKLNRPTAPVLIILFKK